MNSLKEREVSEVLGLKILFYVIAVLLALVFIVAFMRSTEQKPQRDKVSDLLVGVVVFLVFIVLVRVFGGYIV